MKIWAISLAILLLLTGCDASSEIERGMALRNEILKGKNCKFTAKVTADYGDRSTEFTMDCSFDSMGNMDFTVIQPQSISGITGSVSTQGGNLRFDDKVLFFSLLTDEQINPVSAPWIFMKTLRSGYLTSACMESGLLRMSIDDSFDDDALNLDIWLDNENVPVRGEVLYEGERILTIEVESFAIV
ncbi:MAG: hypothetical protein J6V25_01410 [Oscillospiraceae bacterium]|nr:hypothetical protein [Oscillospiraceae bacterium]